MKPESTFEYFLSYEILKAGLRTVLGRTKICQPALLTLTALPAAIQIRYKSRKQRVRQPKSEVEKPKQFTSKKQLKKVLSADVQDKDSIIAAAPVDNVWVHKFYPKPKFSIEEAIKRHNALAQPAMLNNLKGIVFLDMRLDCSTAKKTKFMGTIRSTVRLPHEFPYGSPPAILVFCKKEENISLAETLGAKHVGTPENITKMINNGLINPKDFNHVLCTPDCASDILSLRSHFRDIFPQKAKGTVNQDLQSMWDLFFYGYTFESQKLTDAVGRLQVPLGVMDQPTEELVENFHVYIDNICKHRSVALGPFITSIAVVVPPSTEEFLLKVEDYVPGYKNDEVDSDEEDVAEAQT
ncbi:unnamed protein product [Lymnaea stagnalis]|uniref:Mitochondrial ribosomal protein L1 n=1 Tax=Lymnaea stagnalis TaxID=6523 RepID=A0AAV2HAD2_LYMST